MFTGEIISEACARTCWPLGFCVPGPMAKIVLRNHAKHKKMKNIMTKKRLDWHAKGSATSGGFFDDKWLGIAKTQFSQRGLHHTRTLPQRGGQLWLAGGGEKYQSPMMRWRIVTDHMEGSTGRVKCMYLVISTAVQYKLSFHREQWSVIVIHDMRYVQW